MTKEKVLSVKDLHVDFKTYAGAVKAIRNINFDLYKGETLAIVGESGSGKSVTTRTLMGLNAKNASITGDIVSKVRN
ncbi:Oligopeptide transport ATP-binding protein OppD [Streptococcus parauberis]|nr:Oligopeptide transport ATP-binding protein OppD [Streptococcus parauberis]